MAKKASKTVGAACGAQTDDGWAALDLEIDAHPMQVPTFMMTAPDDRAWGWTEVCLEAFGDDRDRGFEKPTAPLALGNPLATKKARHEAGLSVLIDRSVLEVRTCRRRRCGPCCP